MMNHARAAPDLRSSLDRLERYCNDHVSQRVTPPLWVTVPKLRRLLRRTIAILRFTRVFPPPSSQSVLCRHVGQLLVKSDVVIVHASGAPPVKVPESALDAFSGYSTHDASEEDSLCRCGYSMSCNTAICTGSCSESTFVSICRNEQVPF